MAKVRVKGHALLHIRCSDCTRLVSKWIDIPDAEGAPTTADELLESALLQNVPFQCPECESLVGQLVAVNFKDRRTAA